MGEHPTTSLYLNAADDSRCRLDDLRKFVGQADLLGYSDLANVYVRAGSVCVVTRAGNLPTNPTAVDIDDAIAELHGRVDALTDRVDGTAVSDEERALSWDEMKRVEADRDKALATLAAAQGRIAELTSAAPQGRTLQPSEEVFERANQAIAERDAAAAEVQRLTKLVDDLTRTGTALERAKNKAEGEAEKHKKTAVDNGHRINALTAELAEAKKNAKEPRTVVVGEAEQVQAIETLLIRIAAHRASSHGGRMVDTGDQILYDAANEVAAKFASLAKTEGGGS